MAGSYQTAIEQQTLLLQLKSSKMLTQYRNYGKTHPLLLALNSKASQEIAGQA